MISRAMSSFSARWKSARFREKVSESSEDQQAAYIRATIKQELDSFLDELRASQEQGESHASGCTYKQMLKFIDKFERASKGKLSEPKGGR